MKANGESTVGQMKEGDTFINAHFRDMNVYWVRGEYNRSTKKYYCRCYYRINHLRWEYRDRHWAKDKKVIKYKKE